MYREVWRMGFYKHTNTCTEIFIHYIVCVNYYIQYKYSDILFDANEHTAVAAPKEQPVTI